MKKGGVDYMSSALYGINELAKKIKSVDWGSTKLVRILNEYDSGWDYDDYYGPYQYGQDRDAYKYGKYYLVSRDYGFIKRLVENDKIDRHKFYDKNILKGFMTLTKGEKIDSIIMNLSISDTPIEDLISYLK